MAEASPDDAVVFVGVSLVLGIASRHFLRGTRVPYTVALLILGVAMGSLGNTSLLHFTFIPIQISQIAQRNCYFCRIWYINWIRQTGGWHPSLLVFFISFSFVTSL